MDSPNRSLPSFHMLATRLGRLLADCSGATAIEYSLIATLIAVAIIGGVTTFGSQLNAEWLYLSGVVDPKLN